MSWRQRCKVCGRCDKIDFTVTEEKWEEVVPSQFQNRVVCLSCFDSFASQKGILYASAITQAPVFVGDMLSCALKLEDIKEPIIN